MREVGIRALKQNASEVIADVAQGEIVVVTDRGRPVAQISPLPDSELAAHIATGMIARAKYPKKKLPRPLVQPRGTRKLTATLLEIRASERF